MAAPLLLLVFSTAILLGSEFCIAAFVHPALSGKDALRYLPAIQALARLLGGVMPFWMGGTLLAHAALTFLAWRDHPRCAIALLAASGIWLAISVYSVLGPVPINNRVIAWRLDQPPANWQQERRTWDRLNCVRVAVIAAAFLVLLAAARDYLITG